MVHIELSKIAGFVALAACGACIVFTILALALPYWQTYAFADIHSGLFQLCIYNSCSALNLSNYTTKLGNSLRAIRAMVLIGGIVMIGVVNLLVVHLFIAKRRKIFGIIAGVLAFVSGFFLMVGFSVYVSNVKVEIADYGAGFALNILAWLAAGAAGIAALFATFTAKAEV